MNDTSDGFLFLFPFRPPSSLESASSGTLFGAPTRTTTISTGVTTGACSGSGTKMKMRTTGRRSSLFAEPPETNTIMKPKTKSGKNNYETSDSSSKGLVSSLTSIVNFFMDGNDNNTDNENNNTDNNNNGNDNGNRPPKTPQQLMRFIEEDYTERNYLWTGNIHLPAFEEDCTFTDPTLSFTGTKKFVSNVQNLVPIVDFLTQKTKVKGINDNDGDGNGDDDNSDDNSDNDTPLQSQAFELSPRPRSDLLDITINEEQGYVKTRWNMVGDLTALPWKPTIDVIGNTKFWYRPVSVSVSVPRDDDDDDNTSTTSIEPGAEGDGGYRVYFYDEEWEIEAGTALLQLITPKGSIPNSNL